jgi:hypothetical protein
MIAEITIPGNSPKTIDRPQGRIVMQLILGWNSTTTVMFIVPKVPTIAENLSWYRGDNGSAITHISSLEVFYYTEQLYNSKF